MCRVPRHHSPACPGERAILPPLRVFAKLATRWSTGFLLSQDVARENRGACPCKQNRHLLACTAPWITYSPSRPRPEDLASGAGGRVTPKASDEVGPRHADDGAIHRDQGRQSGLPVVLPDGRFLRDVLRRRRSRLARARHRADQARQASGPRHSDVRRADRARRRVSASADRARPSRRGVRADRRPGRGAQARRQKRRAPRRGAAGDARHADRGFAARRAAQQLSAGAGAQPRFIRRGPLRAGLDRYFDRRIPRRRMRPRGARRPRSPASSRARSSSRTRSTPMPNWRPICARCRRSRRSRATCSTAPPRSGGSRRISPSRRPTHSARSRASN